MLAFLYYMTIILTSTKETEQNEMIKSVDELEVGDILKNVKHGFDIEIRDIGKKNIRYINLETGEKVKSFTGKFNFMLREGVFIK